jgi:hypothetical protein
MEPVAVIEPAYLEVTVGEEIVFDGSNSFDEDGRIVSYEWDFGDAGPGADVPEVSLMSMSMANVNPKVEGVNPSYTYQESGTYVVTLWVTDDKGSTSSVEAEVHAEPPQIQNAVEVRAKFSTRKRYRNGKAKYLSARIEFPEGYDARKVDPASVYIVSEKEAAIFSHVKKKSNFFDKILIPFSKRKKSITVKFDRQAVLASLACPPVRKTELTVSGEIFHNNEWKEFKGTGVIRLKMRKQSRCSAE